MAREKISELLRDGNVIDSKSESDTIRLWESYRDQALLWRAISLFQIPATALAIILCIVLATTRSITLKVPAKPLPGVYAAQEVPDAEFANVATDFVNLITSYQPNVARRQYEYASQMVIEPFLSKFRTDFLNFELKAIETTNRTQFYFIDPLQTKVARVEKTVVVTFFGDRLKIVAGQELPLVQTKFEVTLSMMPRNPLNPYGIMVSNFVAEDIKK